MKRSMIKTIIFTLLAVMSASCVQEGVEQTISSGKVYTAVIESRTRTMLGDGWNVLWQEGDQLSVFSGSTANSCYKVVDGIGTSTGRFEMVNAGSSGNVSSLNVNIAVYPYNSGMVAKADGIVEITLPKVQKYVEGGFGPGVNPMVAATPDAEGDAFLFKNLCSVFKFSLTGTEKITKLEFSGNDEEPISGKAELTAVFGQDPVLKFMNSADTLIVLDCQDGVRLSDTPVDFWIVIPPTTFDKGFKVKATSVEGKVATMRNSQKTVLSRAMIKSAPAAEVKGVYDDDFVHMDDNLVFLRYCIEHFDFDKDGRLSKDEASFITKLDLFDCPLTTLAGVEYFTNLTELYRLTSMDVYEGGMWVTKNAETKISGVVDLSKNVKLKKVEMPDNEITGVVLPAESVIQSIDLSGNKLTSFDSSAYAQLESLDLSDNQIGGIVDLSNNIKISAVDVGGNNITGVLFPSENVIQRLSVRYNKLTSFDPTPLNQLSYLDVSGNQIGHIDLSRNSKLSELWAYECGLTDIDLSGNQQMITLLLENNNFTFIDVSMLVNLRWLYLFGNKLECIDLSDLSNLYLVDCRMSSLKYLVMAEEQTIRSLYHYNGVETITPDSIIALTEKAQLEFNGAGDWTELEIVSPRGCKVVSMPEWITIMEHETRACVHRFKLFAQPNTTATERSDAIVFENDCGKTCPMSLAQRKEGFDWNDATISHKSLVVNTIGYQVESIVYGCLYYYDRVETMNVDSDNFYRSYARSRAIIDFREYRYWSITSVGDWDYTMPAIEISENNYPAVTALRINTYFEDNMLKVETGVFSKVSEEFRLSVVLLNEESEGYRVFVGQISEYGGDAFTVTDTGKEYVRQYEYQLPPRLDKAKLRVLVYVERQFGDRSVVVSTDCKNCAKSCYVDNCASVPVGKSLPLTVKGSGGGGNEGFRPGNDIDF